MLDKDLIKGWMRELTNAAVVMTYNRKAEAKIKNEKQVSKLRWA